MAQITNAVPEKKDVKNGVFRNMVAASLGIALPIWQQGLIAAPANLNSTISGNRKAPEFGDIF